MRLHYSLRNSPSAQSMAKLIHALLVSGLFVASCSAQTSSLTVLPWNDHLAAVSLTFDDARPVHLDVVVPELNKRHLRGTFFVTVSKLTRLDDWRRVPLQGHEIGNHSVSHEHPTFLSREGEEIQVVDAKKFLDSNFKSNISIYAYPYAETSPGLTGWVKRYNFAARGGCTDGGCAGDSLYITPGSMPDWYNLPSQPALTQYDPAVYKSWIDKAFSLHAWTIFQIHGIGDPSTGWEPIPTNTFISLFDYVRDAEAKGLWVAPFGEVAAYMRATDVFEHAEKHSRTTQELTETTYVWDIPENFPPGVTLKVKAPTVDGERKPRANQAPEIYLRLYQGQKQLTSDKHGDYTIAFDAKSLMVVSR